MAVSGFEQVLHFNLELAFLKLIAKALHWYLSITEFPFGFPQETDLIALT